MKRLNTKFFNWKILLILIFLLGFALRFYGLGSVPSGFHADEAAFGYNAYSILHTLRDEYGKLFPIVLKSFGDYKGALYSYLDIPFVALLGLTPLAERIPSAIFDSFTIILIYFFTYKLLNKRKIALIASFVFAISPWAIGITRTTGDVIVAQFFALLMAYALLHLQKKISKLWLVICLLSAVLSVLSYAPFRFFIVIIPVLFFLISIKKTKASLDFDRTAFFIFLTVLIIGLVYTLVASTTRFGQISIFSNPQTQLIMQEQIREDQHTPVIQTRFFHNKIVNFSRTILQNAGQYFTFDYLFLNGGYPLRERIPNVGLFYIWQMPFLLLGIFAIVRHKQKNEIFLVLWWLIMLLPVFITFDEIPNVHRNLIILPMMVIIIAIGIYELFSYRAIKSTRMFPIFILVLLIVGAYEFLYFGHQYFIHQDTHRPWYRGYAYKELVNDLNVHGSKFKKIVVTKGNSSPYIYILFYSKYDPKKYQTENSPRDLDYSGFSKYFFVPSDCPFIEGKLGEDIVRGVPGILYVNMGTCAVPQNAKLIKTIDWEDGSPAFKLLEYVATGSALQSTEF